MKIIERLNDTTYLATRENAGWSYRVIIETSEPLIIGESYTKDKNRVAISSIISLCEKCAELAGYEYEPDMEFSERQKDDALAVIQGIISIEEYQNFYPRTK